MMNIAELTIGRIAYRTIGNKSNSCLVIETAMGASCAEWWHLAEKWSKKYCVLVYDRAGYGRSEISKQSRTPENIAKELNELLRALDINKTILLGHSIGGLYVYQFTRLFPEKVRSLILVDPVSPDNVRFRKELSKQEFQKSGVDKSLNLKIGYFLCSLGLGRLFKPLLKKSPPFYYYNEFSKEAEEYILKHLTNKNMYKTSIKEYSFIENDKILKNLEIIPESIHIPLYLICHTPEIMKKEIEYYGNTDNKTSTKIENLWVEIMREYLKLFNKSNFIQARNSGHSIHLTDPEIIWNVIESAASAPNNA
jgi:pimeloyl-ACP methyl ester carboxylesterase